MPRYKDEHPAVRVYTVCDESKYLIVRNVPALGCGDELSKLFATYGEVKECKPMDAEECEPFTDVYWIKFSRIDNARFAKRKLDEFVFLGNRLQVSYATQYESLSDAKEKLEGRRNEVLARLSSGRSKDSRKNRRDASSQFSAFPLPSHMDGTSQPTSVSQSGIDNTSTSQDLAMTSISSNEAYFSSDSMNQTVQLVRDKLNKIESSSQHAETGPSKRMRLDNRRRI